MYFPEWLPAVHILIMSLILVSSFALALICAALSRSLLSAPRKWQRIGINVDSEKWNAIKEIDDVVKTISHGSEGGEYRDNNRIDIFKIMETFIIIGQSAKSGMDGIRGKMIDEETRAKLASVEKTIEATDLDDYFAEMDARLDDLEKEIIGKGRTKR